MKNYTKWAGLGNGKRVAVIDYIIPVIHERFNVPIGEYVVSANRTGGGMSSATVFLLNTETAERYEIYDSDLRNARSRGHIEEIGE
jgi:hypothetical protein